MYCNVYVPRLQYAAGLVGYVHRQLGLPIASTAPLGTITDRFTTAGPGRSPGSQQHPVGRLRQGPAQGRRHARAPGRVHRGRRGWCSSAGRRRRRTCSAPRNAATPTGSAYPWIVQSTGVVNHFYFYCRRRRLRPVLPQVLLLLPLQRQAVHQRPRLGPTPGRARPGSGSPRWTTRSPPSTTRPRLQAICDRLGPAQIDALLDKWLAILPHPFTDADRAAGYRYELSILQAEFSLTQMLDAPVIRADLLRTGHPRQPRHRPPRPGQPDLRPARSAAGAAADPGPVPHPGDHRRGHPEPARRLQAHQDQAVPQGRDERFGPRPPSTTPATSASGNGWSICPRCGRSASPPTGACSASNDSATTRSAEPRTCTTVTDPVITDTGTRIPGLPLGQTRSHALLSALLIFRTQTSRIHQPRPAHAHRRTPRPGPDHVSAGQVTYDLRRLRTHGLIERDPAHPPLPGHRPRPPHRHADHPRPRPPASHRARPPNRHPQPSIAFAPQQPPTNEHSTPSPNRTDLPPEPRT